MEVKNFPAILIMVLISALFAVALVPTIITQWTSVNTTVDSESGWNFTGAAGAAVLWDLAPFIVIAGIPLAFLLMFITRRGG